MKSKSVVAWDWAIPICLRVLELIVGKKWQLVVYAISTQSLLPLFPSQYMLSSLLNIPVKMEEIKHMPTIFRRCILRKEWGIAGMNAECGFNQCGFVIYKYFHFHLLLGSERELEGELRWNIPRRTCCLQALTVSKIRIHTAC